MARGKNCKTVAESSVELNVQKANLYLMSSFAVLTASVLSVVWTVWYLA